MDANRPLTAREISNAFLDQSFQLSDYDFYRLFTEIEFDTRYLKAVNTALEFGFGDEDHAALQIMVDEISRFEKAERTVPIEVSVLVDSILRHLDRLGVDYRRLIHEGIDHVLHLAGDY